MEILIQFVAYNWKSKKNIQFNASGPRIRKKTYNPIRPARKSGKNLQFNRLCLLLRWLLSTSHAEDPCGGNKYWTWGNATMRTSCWSRKMLQHEYLVANPGFDTAENGPSEVWATYSPTYPRPPTPLGQINTYAYKGRSYRTDEGARRRAAPRRLCWRRKGR